MNGLWCIRKHVFCNTNELNEKHWNEYKRFHLQIKPISEIELKLKSKMFKLFNLKFWLVIRSLKNKI